MKPNHSPLSRGRVARAEALQAGHPLPGAECRPGPPSGPLPPPRLLPQPPASVRHHQGVISARELPPIRPGQAPHPPGLMPSLPSPSSLLRPPPPPHLPERLGPAPLGSHPRQTPNGSAERPSAVRGPIESCNASASGCGSGWWSGRGLSCPHSGCTPLPLQGCPGLHSLPPPLPRPAPQPPVRQGWHREGDSQQMWFLAASPLLPGLRHKLLSTGAAGRGWRPDGEIKQRLGGCALPPELTYLWLSSLLETRR